MEDRIKFLIDDSKSVQFKVGSKDVSNGVKNMVKEFPDDQFSLHAFAEKDKKLINLEVGKEISDFDVDWAFRRLKNPHNLQMDGSKTYLWKGMMSFLEEMSGGGGGDCKEHLILITDGQDNSEYGPTGIDVSNAIEKVKDNLSIYLVLLGSSSSSTRKRKSLSRLELVFKASGICYKVFNIGFQGCEEAMEGISMDIKLQKQMRQIRLLKKKNQKLLEEKKKQTEVVVKVKFVDRTPKIIRSKKQQQQQQHMQKNDDSVAMKLEDCDSEKVVVELPGIKDEHKYCYLGALSNFGSRRSGITVAFEYIPSSDRECVFAEFESVEDVKSLIEFQIEYPMFDGDDGKKTIEWYFRKMTEEEIKIFDDRKKKPRSRRRRRQRRNIIDNHHHHQQQQRSMVKEAAPYGGWYGGTYQQHQQYLPPQMMMLRQYNNNNMGNQRVCPNYGYY